MIIKIINNIKNIEKNILEIMLKGFSFSFIISMLSIFVLLYYILNPISYTILEMGIILFKNSLIYIVCFFTCGIVMDKIKKEM